MSEKTYLYVNSEFWSNDIEDVLRSHLDVKIIKKESFPASGTELLYFTFNNNERQMLILYAADIPIGSALQLSLGADEDGQAILKKIAQVLGGLYQASEYENMFELYNGMLWDADGLNFFIKNAILKNDLKDIDDIDGFLQSREKWLKKFEKVN